jgi:NAD(P)H-nitrite reductase large subunit
VLLGNDEYIKYDSLLVATGSNPFIPPFKGYETLKNVFTFYTLDDAKSLDKAVNKESKVLIIGAGLIGLKCAEGIKDKVKSITVVDMASKILSSIFDDDAAKIVQKHLEDNGLKFKLSNSVSFFEGNTATLASGEKLEFDVLVMAIGVRPNVTLFKDIGGIVNRGIVVDERMKTSVEDIYSAGDCTEGYDVTTGSKRVLALLPSAYMQGETAGINMAGGDKVFDKNMPMNAIGFFGLHIMTAGSYEGETYIDTSKGYKKLYYKDNVLKGFILIENIERAGIYTDLIRKRKPLDEIDFELICKKPALAAFSKKDRKILLGGVKNDN